MAFKATEKQTRRVITTTVTVDKGRRSEFQSLTEEFILPNTRRVLQVDRAGKKATSTEIIEVGDAKYKRVDSGIWSKWIRTEKPVYRLQGVPSTDEPKEVIEYTQTDSRLSKQVVQILSRASNKAFGFLSGAQVYRIWIGKEGLVLKTEEIVSEDNADNVIQETIAIYEYNPKGIKIEVPVR